MTDTTVFNTIVNLLNALGFIFIALALYLQYKQYKKERAVTIREATWAVFDEWWGEELENLREYFYKFIREHSDELKVLRNKDNMGLGDIKEHFEEDNGRLLKLTYFFDQVGWLGAHGLIEVDYILGPMQHVMRRVWWTTDCFIENQRKPADQHWLDPVRHWGLQWLYEYSERQSQLDLVRMRFPGHSFPSKVDIERLVQDVKDDEKKFKTDVGYTQ